MPTDTAPHYEFVHDGAEWTLHLSGVWRTTGAGTLSSAHILSQIQSAQPKVSQSQVLKAQPSTMQAAEPHSAQVAYTLRLIAQDLGTWDSSLLVFLLPVLRHAQAHDIVCVTDTLPEGLARMLRLALAVPPRVGAARGKTQESVIAKIGAMVLNIPKYIRADLAFAGAVTIAVGRCLRGTAQMRLCDFVEALRDCGAASLGIVSLTSLLFGLILAFVGAVQLTQFGAQVYVAGLVGIGVTRVMGAIMVGVVMAGRMGASYAASIGTMQVNEEIDALETLGIQPMDYLVLPRLLALTAMIPILTLYADFMGLVGGFLVGVTLLGLHPLEYIHATMNMVGFKHVLVGLVYSVAFGIIIALSGCRQGIECGRSAAAVGTATTAAVVNAIVGIIVATAIITIIFNVLNV